MFRAIAGSLVIAASLCSQAGAVEIRPDQPCAIRYCAEYVGYRDEQVDIYDCRRWETRIDAHCASMQPPPNGIKLAPPRETQIQPGVPVIR